MAESAKPLSAERLQEIRWHLNGQEADIDDYELDIADLLTEVDRLKESVFRMHVANGELAMLWADQLTQIEQLGRACQQAKAMLVRLRASKDLIGLLEVALAESGKGQS